MLSRWACICVECINCAYEMFCTFKISSVAIRKRQQPDVCLVWASCPACLFSLAVPVLRVVAPAMRPVFCYHLQSACRSLRTWDTMPTMAMQSLNLGGMTRPQTAAAYRSRCAVRTMAVVAAPPKTGLKTEISEKVSLFCGIA